MLLAETTDTNTTIDDSDTDSRPPSLSCKFIGRIHFPQDESLCPAEGKHFPNFGKTQKKNYIRNFYYC